MKKIRLKLKYYDHRELSVSDASLNCLRFKNYKNKKRTGSKIPKQNKKRRR